MPIARLMLATAVALSSLSIAAQDKKPDLAKGEAGFAAVCAASSVMRARRRSMKRPIKSVRATARATSRIAEPSDCTPEATTSNETASGVLAMSPAYSR